jgi:hypothetical protein
VAEQYQAIWGNSYEKPGARIVGLDFFRNADLGYDEEDYKRVEALQIGEAVKLDADEHSVTRIK